VQTRQYRAPEVILQCDYTEKIDVFSAACVCFELLTGDFLFQTNGKKSEIERDREHLLKIFKITGKKGMDFLF
jgi:serine/threonine-protein kinase SRPK3